MKDRRSDYERVFQTESLALDHATQLLDGLDAVDNDLLRTEFKELTIAFEKLLRQAIRLTRTGDRIENQLLEVQKDLRDHICCIEELNSDLRTLNKEKNEFLDIISHDLRSPLSGVHGVLSLIGTDFDNLEKATVSEMTQTAAQSVRRMMRLIETMLDVARIEKGQIELVFGPCDVESMARVLVSQFAASAAAKQIELTLDGPKGPAIALGDPDAIHRVLENLVSNAIKYSPPGKRVWLEVREIGGKWHCRVRDEGPGISAKDQQRLFTKYARLSARPTGDETSTGIGLAIAKGLADQMGAELFCESEPGHGATFTLALRCASNELICEPTASTPQVCFSPDSDNLRLSGECLPEDAEAFFRPILARVEKHLEYSEKLTVELDLSYFNTSSSKYLFDLFSLLEARSGEAAVRVIWRYRPDDEAMRENGEEFAEDFSFPFDQLATEAPTV